MNGARDEFLSRPTLAFDQRRRFALRYQTHIAIDAGHRLALSDHSGQRRNHDRLWRLADGNFAAHRTLSRSAVERNRDVRESRTNGLEDIVDVQIRKPLIENQQLIVAIAEFFQRGGAAMDCFHSITAREKTFHHQLTGTGSTAGYDYVLNVSLQGAHPLWTTESECSAPA